MTENIFLIDQFLVIDRNPMGRAMALVNCFFVLISIILLIKFYKKSIKELRNQAIGLIVAFTVPIIVVILKELSPQTAKILPPTVVFINITGIFTFWAIFRYKLFSVIPVARDKIIEVIKEGIIVIDEYGKVIDKNAAIDGFILDVMETKHDIVGVSIEELIASWPQWLAACKDTVETEFEIETSAWENTRVYKVKVYPLSKHEFEKCGTVSIIYDISKEKNKENDFIFAVEENKKQISMQSEKLNKNEKQLEAIFENMYEACTVMDKDGTFIKMNKAAKEYSYKFKEDQMKGIEEFCDYSHYHDIHGNKLEMSRIPAFRVINGEKVINERVVLKNDTKELHFDVNATPVYDEVGEFLFGITCRHDVTELVQKSKEVESKWLELQQIFENMNDAIYVIDADGFYKFINKAAREFFDNENLIKFGDGCFYSKYYDLENKEITAQELPAQKVLRGITIRGERLKNVFRGKARYISVSGTPVFDDIGKFQYAIISSHEITDIIENQKTIEEQQKKLLKTEIEKNKALQNEIKLLKELHNLSDLNALKDKLLTIVSHDIRNPMATMISFIELLEGDMDQFSDDLKEIIEAVKGQLTNTYNIVESMLDWLKSNRNSLTYNPFNWNLQKIVQEDVNLSLISAEKKNIHIVLNIGDNLNVYVDKNMLHIILRNLLSNAIKFTGNGGSIIIEAHVSDNYTIVAIRDTGMGIENEKVKTMFEDIKSTNSKAGTDGEKGAGLGLLICKEFVLKNGGRIWVDSKQGEGSIFYFSVLSAYEDA